MGPLGRAKSGIRAICVQGVRKKYVFQRTFISNTDSTQLKNAPQVSWKPRRDHSVHWKGCILSQRRREGLAIYTGNTQNWLRSTGRPCRAHRGHLAQRGPLGAPAEGRSSPDACAPAGPAVSLPPWAAVDRVHLLDSQGSRSQPREGLREESSSGCHGVGGTGDR